MSPAGSQVAPHSAGERDVPPSPAGDMAAIILRHPSASRRLTAPRLGSFHAPQWSQRAVVIGEKRRGGGGGAEAAHRTPPAARGMQMAGKVPSTETKGQARWMGQRRYLSELKTCSPASARKMKSIGAEAAHYLQTNRRDGGDRLARGGDMVRLNRGAPFHNT